MFFERGFRVSRRRAVLFTGDLFCVVSSILLASFIRLGVEGGWHYILEHLPSLLGSCIVFLLVFYAGGMYERKQIITKLGFCPLNLLLSAVSLGIVITLFYASLQFYIGRGVLFLAGLLVFISTCLVRRIYRIAAGYGFFSKNTIIVGDGDDAVTAVKLLNNTEDSGFRLFGVVTVKKKNHGEFIEGIPVLGHLDLLREFCDAYEIDTIVLATSLSVEHSMLRVLRPLRYSGVQVMDYVALYEELAMEIPVDHIDDEYLMHAAMNNSRIHIRKLKRIMDVIVAMIGLLLSLPICLLAAVLIKLDSRGPILYRQRRAGLGGKVFTLTKFRTMREDAEKHSGAVWATQNDTRITAVGRFLRKWRIDEIPQLLNVLKGEMSLVGPRPERPEFIDALAEAIPFYQERLLVPPGVTGWAQVNFPYAASIEAGKRKLQFDLYYIKNMGFFLDVSVLLRTFRTILEGIRYGEDLSDPAEKIQDEAAAAQTAGGTQLTVLHRNNQPEQERPTGTE